MQQQANASSPQANLQQRAKTWIDLLPHHEQVEARRLIESPDVLFRLTYQHDPIAFAKDCIKWNEDEALTPYQEEILGLLVEKRRLAVKSPRGAGKCVAPDEDILLADGRYVKAKTLCGKPFAIMAAHADGSIGPAVGYAFDNGLQDVYKVTTRYGREIVRTGNHPLLTIDGWKRVASLDVGQLVGIPLTVPKFGGRSIPSHEIKLLAYLIGDGNIAGSCVQFSQKTGSVLEEFKRCVRQYGCEAKKLKNPYDWRVVVPGNTNRTIGERKKHPNQVTAMLRRYNLLGKTAREKNVPKEIYELPNEELAVFVSRLFATDGSAYISNGKRKHPRPRIEYTSVSRELVTDVQRLMLRFGIFARVRQKKTTWVYKGERKRSWCWSWCISDVASVSKFAERVGIYGKEDVVNECRLVACKAMARKHNSPRCEKWPAKTLRYIMACADREGKDRLEIRKSMGIESRDPCYTVTSWRAKEAAKYLDDEWLNFLTGLDAGWDTITSIEHIGQQPTVGISVPETNMFITDFIEHNTMLSSVVVLWALMTADEVRILTTAGTGRQLTHFLWPEIHKWARRLNWNKVGRRPFNQDELLKERIHLNDNRFAFSAVSNDPSKMEGLHAPRVVVIFDEAKIIPDATWDAMEGAFSEAGLKGREAFALAISTPGDLSGRFYDIFKRRAGLENWYPYAITRAQVEKAGRMSHEWAEQCKRLWGINSQMYQNHIEGQFAPSGDGIIPLAWVEHANNLWDEWVDRGKPGTFIGLGADVGISADKSVLARAYTGTMDFKTLSPVTQESEGERPFIAIDSLRVLDDLDPNTATMNVVGHVKNLLDANASKSCVVDADGIGAGVGHRLREQGYDVLLFHAAEKTELTDETGEKHFRDKRSASWWVARELLDPNSDVVIALPRDHMLISDLTTPRLESPDSLGRSRVESKDKLRKADRLGRSTDHGDAVIMLLSRDALEAAASFGGHAAMLDLPW